MVQPRTLPTHRRAVRAQRRWLAFPAAWILALGAAGEVCAQCTVGGISPLSPQDENWQGSGTGYEVFDPVDYVQSVTVRVYTLFGQTCDYAVGINEGGSGTYSPRQLSAAGSTLDYNLYDTAALSAILRDLPDGGPVISGSFSGTPGFPFKVNLHTIYWTIPAGQLLPPGTYQDTLALEFYDLSAGGTTRAGGVKRFEAQIPPSVELSLVDTGGPFNRSDLSQTLDFGIFFTGEQLTFDLRARGNTGFDVTMQSQNSGVMQHVSMASQVPYSMTVGGSPVDLSSGNAVNVAGFSSPPTGLQGEVYPVVVTVGSLAGTLGGVHRDSITVSLIAN